MADLRRRANATWTGDLKSGAGRMSTATGVLKNTPYSFTTRFENEPGTNPEELLAAAHASCFSMAFAAVLSSKGYKVESIETHATCHLTPQPAGGFKITKMGLVVKGKVAGIDQATFLQIAKETDAGGCPVSALLSKGLTIEIEATLL